VTADAGVVPEPALLGILVFGGLALVHRQRLRRLEFPTALVLDRRNR
jgi:hypothetical protein